VNFYEGDNEVEQKKTNSDKSLNVRKILGILKKRYLFIILIPFVAVLTSGIVSFFVLSPEYETSTVLLVTKAATDSENGNNKEGQGLEGLMNNITGMPEMTTNTYLGQIQSQAVLERVLKKMSGYGYTATKLARSIEISVIGETNLIQVTVTNKNPAQAALIANALTKEFLDFMSENNEQQMTKSMDFLEKQIATTSGEVTKAVQKLISLKSQSGGVSDLEILIKAKNNEITQYRVQLAYAQSKAGLTATIAKKELELTDLQAELAQKKSELEQAQKEVERLKETYTILRTKMDETQIAKSIKFGDSNLVVVSQANIPETPVGPNKILNMLVALVAGLAFSFGLIFLLEYMDNSVQTPKEVEDLTGLPVLGNIPFSVDEDGKIWR
jgi:succinoglycan biosynthesis transport protein ExoP